MVPAGLVRCRIFGKNRDGAGGLRSYIDGAADEVPGSRQADGKRTIRHRNAADPSSVRRGDPHAG